MTLGQKKEMEEEERHSLSRSPRLSLLRTRSSTAAAPTASRSYEMTGVVQDAEDDVEIEISPLQRVYPGIGRRSQASGLESGLLVPEPQTLPTFLPPARNTQVGESGRREQTKHSIAT